MKAGKSALLCEFAQAAMILANRMDAVKLILRKFSIFAQLNLRPDRYFRHISSLPFQPPLIIRLPHRRFARAVSQCLD